MRKLPLIFISLFAVLCYSSCDKCCGPDEGYPPPPVEIRIGALLSATGSGSSTGESSLTSLKLAQQDINSVLKTEFVHQAEIYDGVTGNTTLDVNGDRAVGNYDFWGIKQQSSAFSWVVVARYNSATGVLTRYVQ